jgi:hypothetical protein
MDCESNRLEYRYGSKSTVPRKSRSYVNGTFELQRVKDEGHVYWELGFKGSKGWTDRGVLWRQIGSPRCTPEQLQNLAVVLAKKTTWPLTVAPEMASQQTNV